MESYIELMERLRIITINRATGKTGDFIPFLSSEDERKVRELTIQENEEYIKLRNKLLVNLQLEYGVPTFVKVCHSMPEFWSYIKTKFNNYRDRRNFLNEELNQAIGEYERRIKILDTSILIPLEQDHTSSENTKTTDREVNFDTLNNTINLLKYWLNSFTESNEQNRLSAFWNIVIYGRMVTFHLKKVTSHVKDFAKWYETYLEFMKNDELMTFFKDLRNRIEKEGLIFPEGSSTFIKSLKLPDDLVKLGPRPPGAKSFFIGDSSGGSGWIVMGPDGKSYKQYVKLPKEIGNSGLILNNMPKTHKGVPLQFPTLEKISELYVDYLTNLIMEAKARFSHN